MRKSPRLFWLLFFSWKKIWLLFSEGQCESDYIEIKSKKVRKVPQKRKHTGYTAASRPDPSGVGDPEGYPDHDDGSPDQDDGDDGHNNDNNERCPSCFMQPCVTESQRNLGGQGQGPSECNPSIRKSIYRKFWSVIDNLGGWHIEAYENKKRQEAKLHNIVYLKREIMPDCVLTFTRGLYPNPAGQLYMGHMWE